MAKILAVIILYHPETQKMTDLVNNSLAYSGCDVFLSDNAEISDELKQQFNSPHIIYHPNGSNLGLGAAQNKGLKQALEKNYDYAVLFDQDSQISPDFIENLVREFELARQKDPKVIAAGPVFKKTDPTTENTYRNMIIASGTIIYLPLLKDVGLMDEMLFIDEVDTEWCCRVRAKGYVLMKLGKVRMTHHMGQTKKTWFGMTLPYAAYHRYYYIFRNAIILIKRGYMPWRSLWKLRKHVFRIPLLDHRWQRMTLMCKGIWDGLRS